MLLNKKELSVQFCTYTEGEAKLKLLATNQDLRANIATKKGNTNQAKKHKSIADRYKDILNYGLHKTVIPSALSNLNSIENSLVQNIISMASKDDKPSITLTKTEEKAALRKLNGLLNNNPIDEFDPTIEQLSQCRAESYKKAFDEELKNGRTFDPGTFDPNTQEVHPLGVNGRLVVIQTANLKAREQRLFESCSARIVMENIVNKKLTEAGNLVIYRLMEDTAHDIKFNNKVNNRIVQQSTWINETAKATGLSFDNIRLLLENSAMNINEQTPSDTLANLSPIIADPNSQIPTTLPSISTEQASGNMVTLIVKIVINLIFEIIDAIKKRRQNTYNQITDPSVIAARCTDANIPLENCEGLPPDYDPDGDNKGGAESNNTLLYVGGAVLVGLGISSMSNGREDD